MNRKDYPGLGETVYEITLSNGLLTRIVTKPGFAKTYAFLAVDYGSIDTAFTVNGKRFVTPDGVAHYLEHKMFDLPDCNTMQQFAALGGSPNAFTSYDMTAYYVECTDHVAENLELLLRFVTTPYFTKESVEKERGIIAQEIRMYEDSADSCVYEELFRNLYRHHPVRVPIAGTVESIQAITEQTLYDCHRTFYTPQNMMLVVVGDVDPARVAEIAERTVPAVPGTAFVRDYGAPETMAPLQTYSERHMEVSMPTFALGFKAEPAAYGPDAIVQEIVGELASEVLAGESSPLYTRMYEDALIDSSFAVGCEGLKLANSLTAGGDAPEPEAVYEALLREAERIAVDGIDDGLFSRLKRSSIGRRIRNLDSFESICYRMSAYHFEGADYFTFPEVFDAVTMDQVAEFLRRTVKQERAAMAVIKPLRTGG